MIVKKNLNSIIYLLFSIPLISCWDGKSEYKAYSFEKEDKTYNVLIKKLDSDLKYRDGIQLDQSSPIKCYWLKSYYLSRLELDKASKLSLNPSESINGNKEYIARVGEEKAKLKYASGLDIGFSHHIKSNDYEFLLMPSKMGDNHYAIATFKRLDGRYYLATSPEGGAMDILWAIRNGKLEGF